jgi:hypothetical protein
VRLGVPIRAAHAIADRQAPIAKRRSPIADRRSPIVM